MSITRYAALSGIVKADLGKFVTHADHVADKQAEVARLTAERDVLVRAAQALVDADDSTPAPDGGIHVTFAELDAFTERWTKARDALRAALAALPAPPEG